MESTDPPNSGDPSNAVQLPIRHEAADEIKPTDGPPIPKIPDSPESCQTNTEIPSLTVTPAESPTTLMSGQARIVRNLSSLSLGPSSATDSTLFSQQLTALDEKDRVQVDPDQLPPFGLLCTSKMCPIKETHNGGYYRHDGKDWSFKTEDATASAERVFGRRNNPPAWIWDALERVLRGEGEREEDQLVIEGFRQAHPA